jgi:hypothetical protein
MADPLLTCPVRSSMNANLGYGQLCLLLQSLS